VSPRIYTNNMKNMTLTLRNNEYLEIMTNNNTASTNFVILVERNPDSVLTYLVENDDNINICQHKTNYSILKTSVRDDMDTVIRNILYYNKMMDTNSTNLKQFFEDNMKETFNYMFNTNNGFADVGCNDNERHVLNYLETINKEIKEKIYNLMYKPTKLDKPFYGLTKIQYTASCNPFDNKV